MIVVKLPDDSAKYQRQPDVAFEDAVEIELVKQFIEYFYYEREYMRDSHDRFVIIVKYGKDIFRIVKNGDDFIKWYNSK